MFTGLLIGLPLYYNAGFVILVPLVFTLTRKTGLPILYIAIPMAASLSTTHCFLPPHPGPVVIVNALQADTGKVLLYGLTIALPAVVIAGPLLGGWLRKMQISTPLAVEKETDTVKELPGALPSFTLALLPVILITLNTLSQLFLQDGFWLKTLLGFLGDSTMALFLAVLLAFYQFGIRQGKSMDEVMGWLSSAISGIAMILFIITAGGIFKQVLQDSGTATYIASFSSRFHLPPLLFGWMITALLRVTIGSATVAGITAAGIVAPLVAVGGVSPELMVLAVGSGSVFCSHVNDSGFWMFKEFFGLSLKQTFWSWTLMETTISIIGLAGVLILDLVL
jgi:Gnt-I system high-affinity gluconate transporter